MTCQWLPMLPHVGAIRAPAEQASIQPSGSQKGEEMAKPQFVKIRNLLKKEKSSAKSPCGCWQVPSQAKALGRPPLVDSPGSPSHQEPRAHLVLARLPNPTPSTHKRESEAWGAGVTGLMAPQWQGARPDRPRSPGAPSLLPLAGTHLCGFPHR